MKKKKLGFSAALLLMFCLAVSMSAPVSAAQEVVGGAPVSEAGESPDDSKAAAEAEALGMVPALMIETEAPAPASGNNERSIAASAGVAAAEQTAAAVETAEDTPLTDEDLEARDAVAASGAAVVQARTGAACEPVVDHSRSSGKELITNWAQVSALRKAVVEYAKQFEGGTYTYGGTTPDSGFDCSGFILYVMKQTADIALQHQSAAQARSGVSVTEDEMQPGDIIAYDGQPRNGSVNHVSIYIGDGKAIHAVGTGKGIQITAWDYAAPLEIRNVLGD